MSDKDTNLDDKNIDLDKNDDDKDIDLNNNDDKDIDLDKNDDDKDADLDKKTVPLSTFLNMKKQNETNTKALKEIQDKMKDQDDAKLIEDGKLKELYDKTVDENKSLKVKADKWEVGHAAKIAKVKELMGEDWRDDMASLSDDSLDIFISTKGKKDPSVDMDGNDNPNNGKPKIKLSDDQKAKAIQMYGHLSKEDAYKAYASIADKVEKKIKKE